MNFLRPILIAVAATMCVAGTLRSPQAQAQASRSETNQDQTAANAASESETVQHREIVAFGRDVVLKKNETSRDIVVIGGNADIEGTVEGDVVVVFGSAKITGMVERGLVVVLGSSDVGPNAKIKRDAVVVGGKLNLAPGAEVGGERVEVVLGDKFPGFGWVGDWFVKGLMWARPLPPQFGWVWGVAAAFAVIYLLLAALFPQPVQSCVNALQFKPAGSFLAGLLALALFGPVVFLLIMSVAGILVAPILFFALLIAVFFGKVAVYRSTGEHLGRRLHVAALESPLVALLVGLIIFYLLYMIPVIGFLVWGVATAWGLGAVLMACFSNVHKAPEPAPVLASPAVLGAAPPPPVEAPPSPPRVEPAPSDAPPAIGSMPAAAEMVSLRRAGFWIRFWATMLDLILLGTLASFLGPFFLLLWAAYHVAMWAWKGTTIGGIVLGLKVIRTDGRPVDFAVALVRSLASFFSALVLFLGFFWAGWDPNKQSWHDKIAGTVIVKVPKGTPLI